MYKVFDKEHNLLGYVDDIDYIKVRTSLGCKSYVACGADEAEGIAFKGTAYNAFGIKGADKLEGVETVYLAKEPFDDYVIDEQELAALKASNTQKDEVIEYLNAKISYMAETLNVDLTAVTDEQFEEVITEAAAEAKNAGDAEDVDGETMGDDETLDEDDGAVVTPDDGTVKDTDEESSTNW